MHKIAVMALKGGAGKTTILVHLAVAAWQEGRAVRILDTDPQRSAATWSATRQGAPGALAILAGAVGRELGRPGAAEELVLVDTAPASSAAATSIARLVDLVVMPCRPSAFDFAAIGSTAAIVRAAGVPGVFLLNACPSGNRFAPPPEILETRQALEALGFPVAPVELVNRRAYARAVTSGASVAEYEPAGKAADEIRRLWRYLEKEF